MKKKDYLIIMSLFLIVLIAFVSINLFSQNASNVGKVYINNDVLIEVNFDNDTFKLYPQKEDKNYPKQITPFTDNEADIAFVVLGEYFIEGRRTEVVIEVNYELKSIRIERDETPKQIGVNRDWYNGKGLPVVSLPNKISIVFEQTDDDGVDIII